jgi:hypothetical protein
MSPKKSYPSTLVDIPKKNGRKNGRFSIKKFLLFIIIIREKGKWKGKGISYSIYTAAAILGMTRNISGTNLIR